LNITVSENALNVGAFIILPRIAQYTCHKCASSHIASDCIATSKRCINCIHKIRMLNLKINNEHDALSEECPTFKRAFEEEKKRTD